MAEEAADDAVLALHEIEIAVPVPPTDGHPRDEMVEDEVVQDDDAGRSRSASTIHACASGLFPTW